MGKAKNSERLSQLRSSIESKLKGTNKSPTGFLKICKNHGKDQCYHIIWNHGPKMARYLSMEEDEELIRALAQKSYDMQVIKAAEQELKALEMFEKYYPDVCAEDVYDTLSPIRQKLVIPIRQPDEEYRAQWEKETFEPGYFHKDAPVYLTSKGERVRSKSELLVANLIERLDLPYRYEYPIFIEVDGDLQTWRPDFTILDVKNRKEYHLEHFGMMDDKSESNYARRALDKIRIYEENGMYEGENMIYSFETSNAPLDITYLEMKLRRIFELD